MQLRTLLFMTLCALTVVADAQKSDKYRPKWVGNTAQLEAKKHKGANYNFLEVETMGPTLEKAMLAESRIIALMERMESTSVISSSDSIIAREKIKGTTVDGFEEYRVFVQRKQEVVPFVSREIDSYWEKTKGGDYVVYTLYAIGYESDNPQFDELSSKSSYGLTPMFMSVIPGLGQMYKGQRKKGIALLSTEAVLGIGALVCENQRSSFHTKMLEHPSKKKYYDDRADKWAMGRNFCLGAAAAVYVYNLVDAATSNGAKRIKVKKAADRSYALYPMVDYNHTGVGLAINF